RERAPRSVQQKEKCMRFLCLYRSKNAETNKPPTQQEMEAMGKLMQEMAQAGVLLGTEGCEPSAKGARIQVSSGSFAVNDGPFTDSNGLIGGYARLKVDNKAEESDRRQRFFPLVGERRHETP